MIKALGRHLLIELYGCDKEVLQSVELVQRILHEAAKRAKATIVNEVFHQFSPYGVSGVVVVQESHLAIHTWPEHGYAAVDIFTCGEDVDPEAAALYVIDEFKAHNYSIFETSRGNMHIIEKTGRFMLSKEKL